MSNGIPPTNQTPEVKLSFDDGTNMTMDRVLAKELDSGFDRFIEGTKGNPTYGREDAVYSTVASLIDRIDDAGISASRTNSVRFDGNATEYSENVSWLMSNQQRIAEDTGEGDAAFLASIGRSFSNALEKAMPEPKGRAETNGTNKDVARNESGEGIPAENTAKGQTPSQEVVGDVREFLDDAKATNNSSQKSSALSDAIQALIAAIRGETPVEPTGSRADELSSKLDQVAESLGDSNSVAPKNEVSNAEEPAEKGNDAKSKADPERSQTSANDAEKPAMSDAQSNTYAGDDLMSMLEGTSKRMPDKPASLSLDSRDQGIGVGEINAQVGSGESLTFRAPQRAEGGSVELVDLFANDRNEAGGQDVAKLKVYDGQELVKEIEVRGNNDGKQTVDIDTAFDRIEMTSVGKDSDFALKSVTLNGKDESEAPEATAKPAPVDGSDVPSSDFSFDKGELLSLLQGLGGALDLIDGSKDLSNEQKDAMFDKIRDLLDSIVNALDSKGEGGAEITREELVDIVEGVEGLNTGIEGNVEDGAEKNAALDGLADAVAQIFSAVETNGEDDGEEAETTPSDGSAEPEIAIA